jgi:hypothetical protein
MNEILPEDCREVEGENIITIVCEYFNSPNHYEEHM